MNMTYLIVHFDLQGIIFLLFTNNMKCEFEFRRYLVLSFILFVSYIIQYCKAIFFIRLPLVRFFKYLIEKKMFLFDSLTYYIGL